MELKELLENNKSDIIKKWFDSVIKTYPQEKSQFFKRHKDSFENPVGHSISISIKDVFEGLLKNESSEKIKKYLDPAIRMRAIQEFTPSNAVGFVFYLKTIVRELIKKEKSSKKLDQQLLAFELEIDVLALIAFDIYMGCREQIFTYRANHVRSRTLRLLEKADMLCDVPEVGTEIIPHDIYKNGGFGDK